MYALKFDKRSYNIISVFYFSENISITLIFPHIICADILPTKYQIFSWGHRNDKLQTAATWADTNILWGEGLNRISFTC